MTWLFDTNPAIYQGLAYFLWFFDACVADIHFICYLEGVVSDLKNKLDHRATLGRPRLEE